MSRAILLEMIGIQRNSKTSVWLVSGTQTPQQRIANFGWSCDRQGRIQRGRKLYEL